MFKTISRRICRKVVMVMIPIFLIFYLLIYEAAILGGPLLVPGDLQAKKAMNWPMTVRPLAKAPTKPRSATKKQPISLPTRRSALNKKSAQSKKLYKLSGKGKTKSQIVKSWRGYKALQQEVEAYKKRALSRFDCASLIRGDEKTVKVANTNSKSGISPTENKYLLGATKNCSTFLRDNYYQKTPLSPEEENFPIAYILTVHKNAEQVKKLLKAIYTPNNVYCFHICKGADKNFQDSIESLSKCFNNVFVASKLERVIYGGYSRLKADINCMQDLTNYHLPWKYVINICGQDFPLKTNGEMVKYMSSLRGKNDIPGVIRNDTMIIDRTRYIYKVSSNNRGEPFMKKTNLIKASPPPHNITLICGSAYYIASVEFIRYILTSKVAQDLLSWLKDAYSPDEHFWATANRLADAPGGTTLLNWKSRVRAIKWKYFENKQYPPCQGYYVRFICVYGPGDLNWLAKQAHLFANKFDINTDPVTLQCLSEEIANSTWKQAVSTLEKLKQHQL